MGQTSEIEVLLNDAVARDGDNSALQRGLYAGNDIGTLLERIEYLEGQVKDLQAK